MKVWALALELKGDWEKAIKVYHALYSDRSVEMQWIVARRDYAQYLALQGGIPTDNAFRFEEFCELILDISAQLDVDDIVKKVKRFDGRGNFVPYSPECEGYEQVRELYLFRDRCARIVNPRLHYMCGYDVGQITILTRKSFKVYIEEFENYCRRFNDTPLGSEPNSRLLDKAGRALVFLKRVSELPY